MLMLIPTVFWPLVFGVQLRSAGSPRMQLSEHTEQLRAAFLRKLYELIGDATWCMHQGTSEDILQRAQLRSSAGALGSVSTYWQQAVPSDARRDSKAAQLGAVPLLAHMDSLYKNTIHPLRDSSFLLSSLQQAQGAGNWYAVAVLAAQLQDNLLQMDSVITLPRSEYSRMCQILSASSSAAAAAVVRAAAEGRDAQAASAALSAVAAALGVAGDATAPKQGGAGWRYQSVARLAQVASGAAARASDALARLAGYRVTGDPGSKGSLVANVGSQVALECFTHASRALSIQAESILLAQLQGRHVPIAQTEGAAAVARLCLELLACLNRPDMAHTSSQMLLAAQNHLGGALATAVSTSAALAVHGAASDVHWMVPVAQLMAAVASTSAADPPLSHNVATSASNGTFSTVRSASTAALGGVSAESLRLWAVLREGEEVGEHRAALWRSAIQSDAVPSHIKAAIAASGTDGSNTRIGSTSPWEAMLAVSRAVLSSDPPSAELQQQAATSLHVGRYTEVVNNCLSMCVAAMSQGAAQAVGAIQTQQSAFERGSALFPSTLRAAADGARPECEPLQQTAAHSMLSAWLQQLTLRAVQAMPQYGQDMPGVSVATLQPGSVPQPYVPLLLATTGRQVMSGSRKAIAVWKESMARNPLDTERWMRDLKSRPCMATGILSPLVESSFHSDPKPASVVSSALLLSRMAASSVAGIVRTSPPQPTLAAVSEWSDALAQHDTEAATAYKALSDAAQKEFRNVYFDRDLPAAAGEQPTAAVSLPGVPQHMLSLVYLCKGISMLSDSTPIAKHLIREGALDALLCSAEHARRMDDAYAKLADASAEALRASWGPSAAGSAVDPSKSGMWHVQGGHAAQEAQRQLGGAPHRTAAPRWRFFAHNHTKICRHVARSLANFSFRLPREEGAALCRSRELLADFAGAQDLKLVAQVRRAEANMASRTASEARSAKIPRYGPMVFPLTDDLEGGPGGAPPPENDVDIVFVHGLQGSALKTWKCPGLRLHDHVDSAVLSADVTLREAGVRLPVWPAAWLVPDLRAAGINARVLSLEYDAELDNTAGPRPTAPLTDVAGRGVAQLAAARVGRNANGSRRPVLYVVHSMGGLLVKTILCDIDDLQCEDDGSGVAQVADSARGIVMYGVPHRGSPLGKPIAPASLPLVRNFVTMTEPVSRLAENDPTLLHLHERFVQYMARRAERSDCGDVEPLDILSVLEGRVTDIQIPGVPLIYVVREWSGSIEFGRHVTVDSDHVNLCKPMTGSDPIYQLCRQFITEIMQS